MQKILILNAKGGSGKTTIATNLAAYYANKGRYPALLDYDPQSSALNWLHTRASNHAPIHGVEAHKQTTAVTRSWQMRMPKAVDRVIIDTPASVSGAQLADYVRQADVIIIPVLPSPIDVHTATNFIEQILVLGKLRTASPNAKATRIGVVANRMKENTRVFKSLRSFLAELHLPLVTSISESQYYIHAYIEGLGLHELKDARTHSLCNQWQPLMDWLEEVPNVQNNVSVSSESIDAIM